MPSNLTIKIGDITTTVEWQSGHCKFSIPQAYRPFVADNPGDLRLELHLGAPQLELQDKVFDSQPIWSLYQNRTESVIDIFDQHPDLRRFLVFPQQPCDRADLFFTAPAGQFITPFFGPTMELLMINYLARGQGVIIHGCGIELDGQGLLFAGESGAGKSTLANLWQRDKNATVLSDDRTLVRYIDGEFRMYGTPWHGEAKFGSPRGVRLADFFFLKHGTRHSIRKLSAAESVSRMLQCSFPPYWNAAGMQFSLQFFDQLASGIGCRQLTFRPDESVLQFVNLW